jgi:inorganic pyrophosphatase
MDAGRSESAALGGHCRAKYVLAAPRAACCASATLFQRHLAAPGSPRGLNRPPTPPPLHPFAVFHAIIETPRGCSIKYKLDPGTGSLKVDHCLTGATVYPANYCFIPRTMADDEQALDVLVLMQESVHPFSFMRAKPIGLIRMRDAVTGATDDKVIAVHADDPEVRGLNSITELPPHRLAEIQRFFADYTLEEKKTFEMEEGKDPFMDAAHAKEVMAKAAERYVELYVPKRPRTG